MKLYYLLSLLILGTSAASAIAVAEPESPDANQLWKRKGGGRGGSRGGSGRSGSSSSSSSRGSSGSSSSSSSRGGKGSSGSSSSSSSRPGSPGFPGSGAPRSFAGGRFYGGGAVTPYKSGSRSPGGLAAGVFLGAAALAFWPGLWLYGAYPYYYPDPYRFRNETAEEDEELPVICACVPDSSCGCDANDDTAYLQELIGDGNYNNLNHSLITVAEVDGQKTILINGTLPEGTEPPVPSENGASAISQMAKALGFSPILGLVLATVFMA